MGIIDKLNGAGEGKSTPTEDIDLESNQEENQKNNESTLEDTLQENAGQKISRDENKSAESTNEKSREDIIVQLKDEMRRERKSHKTEMREIRSIVSELTSTLEAEANRKLTKQKIDAFAEKVGADPETIAELATLLKDDINPQKEKSKKTVLKSQEDDQEDDEEEDDNELPQKIDNRRLSMAVDTMIKQFLKDMPEYKEVLDEDIIKDLIIANPRKYSQMTMTQIVEKVYPNISGKKGIENPRPQKRDSTDKKLQYNNINEKDFKEVLNDPDQRKEYRSDLLSRAKKYF